MRSTVTLTVDITHSRNLPVDAEGIAGEVGRLLTGKLGVRGVYDGDPKLLATATVQGAWMQRDATLDPAWRRAEYDRIMDTDPAQRSDEEESFAEEVGDELIDDLDDRHPCRQYGHFDCSTSEGGDCLAEHYARRMAEEENR
jgi:hypothetical protein